MINRCAGGVILRAGKRCSICGASVGDQCAKASLRDFEQLQALRNAAIDALAGWKYIRDHHGDLYGVGWDRVQTALEEALSMTRPLREADHG